MRRNLFSWMLMAAATIPFILAGAAVPAEKISIGQVRELLQHLGGADFRPEQVQIRRVASGLAGDVIVEAQIETAWRMTQEKGRWRVAEVRLGDRHWESLELVEEAVRREKIRRTLVIMERLGGALEVYHREKGAFVDARRISALLDAISPRYLPTPVRLDLWGQELDFEGSSHHYRLRSAGPDTRLGTKDDLLIEGQSSTGKSG
ncbi:MAG: hypothetical protein EBU88_11015 [Acidobacteria bacterium]|nr:hypothetical protein [Acidobacteriota bacterium]